MDIRYAGGFPGEMPILNPRVHQGAQIARNLYRRHGTLKPERAPADSDTLTGVYEPANLYRYDVAGGGDGFWFSWSKEKDVDVARSPIANDAYERVYWSGDGAPKMGGIDMVTSGNGPYPSAWYQLGVPAPTGRPIANEPGDRDPPRDQYNNADTSVDYPPLTAIEVVYVVTLVTRYGEEGPPSLPSSPILRWDDASDIPGGGSVVLTLPAVPSANADITTLRIYRAESGDTYQFVTDVTAGTTTYHDQVQSLSLGVSLPSLDWDMPDPRMRGLTVMPNGILAGFFENTLAFSEAYRPHAWPVGYQLAFYDPIVGLAAISGGLVVLTTGQPWLVVGSSPAAMSQMKLDANQSCVSKRSIVDMGGYALYASPDGLVAVGGNEAQLLTREVFSREQWQALNPATMHAYRYDGRYVVFYEGGCMAFTPGEGVEFYDVGANAGYYDDQRDTLYIVQGNDIREWGRGSPMVFVWRSPITQIPPGAAGFSCGKVVAASYPVTLRLIADSAVIFEQPIASNGMFRLPAGHTLRREWEIEVESTHEVYSLQIATSPSELV
nr:hypothetical protein [uncultured Halomonas sp.]